MKGSAWGWFYRLALCWFILALCWFGWVGLGLFLSLVCFVLCLVGWATELFRRQEPGLIFFLISLLWIRLLLGHQFVGLAARNKIRTYLVRTSIII